MYMYIIRDYVFKNVDLGHPGVVISFVGTYVIKRART